MNSSSPDRRPHLANTQNRIYAHGEMAERVCAYAWEATPLGPIGEWPEVLVWSVNTMLESRFPTTILWGPEMLQFYNDAYLPLTAEKHPALLGRSAPEQWSEAWHIIGPQFDSVLANGAQIYQENVVVPCLRNGLVQDVYWTYSYSPIRAANGEVLGTLVVCHDVTAKLAVQRERDAVSASLRQVLDSIADGLLVLDKDWRYTYFSEQGARMIGVRPADMVGNCVWDLFPQAAHTAFGREYRRAVETGEPTHFEEYYPEPLNLWLECNCYPSKQGLSVYFRDITERKRAEQALRASESRFRKLFEWNLMGVCIPDRFGGFSESNDELLRMTGYTREDLEAGLFRWDVMTPLEYVHLDAEHIKEAAQRGSCTPYEKEYLRKDGGRVPILCGYALLEGSQDEYIGFVLDLSPQKLAEQALRASESRFRALAETLPQLIWTADAEGAIDYGNRRVFEYFGVAPDNASNELWREHLHPDDAGPTFTAWRRAVETAQPFHCEYRLRRHDGAYRHFLVRAIPIRNDAGELERWIGSATDIHDEKMAEEALRRNEKLATAGRLAASIAHEINNPLTSVTNALYLALQDASLNSETRDYLQLCERELSRVAQITTQTLRFHKQSKAAASADLCEVMDSVLALFKSRLADRGIAIVQECEPDSRVECFADEVRQVFANLIGNALDATPPGGKLRIRINKSRAWDGQGTAGVKVIVADTGHGIPASIKRRLFEPFVSTKEATGVGLGLWVSQGIIRKHKGKIKIRSREAADDHGTVLSLFFPARG